MEPELPKASSNISKLFTSYAKLAIEPIDEHFQPGYHSDAPYSGRLEQFSPLGYCTRHPSICRIPVEKPGPKLVSCQNLLARSSAFASSGCAA